ncbi:MAG TPA: disulfide bond formation protein B [Eoetvoesiella sp.]|jgi:disulfide bond formation protein DsbB|uniref:disulfide bond formation protein B n=1 Tax=Eoetvoesiella sp. TaxID=1966355 RepID=UPI002B57CD06|nr:disulfide bond formation protein B [Eoetvoesiella sp.]HWK62592.1 disulfide bond formation protein B [Eoetvoesiella sp.]
MPLASTRLLNLIALLCVAAVAVALVSQHVFGLRPCAWCVLQRLIYLAIAVVCWLGVLLARFSALRQLASAVAAALGIGGMMAAWYQYNVAAKMFSCDQTFADRFMVHSGLDAHLPWLFGIFASCMDARVHVLGVEYSIWSLMLFAVLALMSLIALAKRR